MNCVSCDIRAYHLVLFVFFPGVFLSSRVTGACSVTTDLIVRVNVRTTTTTTMKGRANGLSVAIEYEQTRPDDKGCDNEAVW